MGHTGTLRMIVLLSAVIKSAKPYTFSQVHVKQVTTLPWHFTPKGALYGPIYGIYMG